MSIRIYGNRELKTLAGQQTRPTAARVRSALFDIWRGRIRGCCWLDLCAGSGAMGAEALCRGAAQAVAIEQSGAACRVIQQNWQKVATPEQTFAVLRGDVVKRLPKLKSPVDLVYFDPPYDSGLYGPVLQALAAHPLLAGAEIAVEHSPALWQPEAISGLELRQEKRYGKTAIAFLRRA